MSRIILAAVALALSPGCGPSAIPVPQSSDLSSAPRGTKLEDLRLGRDLYVRKCSGCHSLYRPEERSSKEWAVAVPGMAEQARLTTEEVALIVQYLRAVAPGSAESEPRASGTK